MIDLLNVLYKHKVKIFAFAFFCTLLSVFISSPLIMPPYFRSFSVFYPLNPSNLDRTMLFKMEAGDLPVHYYGTNNDINRVLSVSRSTELAAHLIDKFDLINHYEIDTIKTKKYWHKVYKEFYGNYKAVKTDLSSIEISILDKDPVLAAKIVNEAIRWIDEKNKSIIFANASQLVTMLEEEIVKKREVVNQLSDSLDLISVQKSPSIKYILMSQFESFVRDINTLTELRDQNYASMIRDYATLFVVEYASPSEMKHKPVRWVIVLGTFIASFLFVLILFVLSDKVELAISKNE